MWILQLFWALSCSFFIPCTFWITLKTDFDLLLYTITHIVQFKRCLWERDHSSSSGQYDTSLLANLLSQRHTQQPLNHLNQSLVVALWGFLGVRGCSCWFIFGYSSNCTVFVCSWCSCSSCCVCFSGFCCFSEATIVTGLFLPPSLANLRE